MRSILWSLLTLFLVGTSAAPAAAQATRIDAVEIEEVGIYSADTTQKVDDSSQAAGHTNVIADIKLVEKTITIPAGKGIHFGYRYRVVGAPARATVSITRITRFPEQGMRNPATGTTTFRNVSNITATLGETTYVGYHLEDDFELVPGVWTFELWNGDLKLSSQTFTLVKP